MPGSGRVYDCFCSYGCSQFIRGCFFHLAGCGSGISKATPANYRSWQIALKREFSAPQILHARFVYLLGAGIYRNPCPGRVKNIARVGHEYNQLQPVIHREEEADLISMANLASLVSETYLQGLNVLDHALEIERAIGSTDIKQLQAEIKSLEQKAATVKNSPASVESLCSTRRRLTSTKNA